MALRPYQQECIDAVHDDLRRGLRRVGVSLPTGTGKTHVMTELGLLHGRRGVLYLVHRDQLVEQTVKKLAERLKGFRLSIGVVKAARNDWHADVVVASIHTLRSPKRRAFLQQRKFALCIPDEAHVTISPTYATVFEELGVFRDDGCRMVGFSATWIRSDGKGLGDVWQHMSFERDISWAIDNGFLVKPRGLQLGYGLDMTQVRQTAGDYNEGDLQKVILDNEDLRYSVVRGYLEHAKGRPSALFAPTMESAEYFVQALNQAGVPAEGVYATVSGAKRREIFRRFESGATMVLGTCTALAEGWDAPWCSCAMLVRPTRHVGLYVQMIGRVLRPHRTKTDALVLDFVGATDDKTLSVAIDLGLTPRKRERDMPEGEEDGGSTPEDRTPMVKKIRGVTMIDLLGKTDARMLVTDHGIPFVSTGDELIFVWETTSSGWSVCRCPARTMDGGRTTVRGLDYEAAVRRASAEALGSGSALVRKRAAWRRSDALPTAQQVRMARQYGIDVTDMTKSDLSDRLDVKHASRVLQSLTPRNPVRVDD